MLSSRRTPLALALAMTASASGCASSETRPPWTFFPVAGWRDGPATLALSAIPGIPVAAAGFALTGPLALHEPGAAFLGPIVLLTLATPIVFPFWILGRAIDDVARESSGPTPVEARAREPEPPPPRPRPEPPRSRAYAVDEAWRGGRGGP